MGPPSANQPGGLIAYGAAARIAARRRIWLMSPRRPLDHRPMLARAEGLFGQASAPGSPSAQGPIGWLSGTGNGSVASPGLVFRTTHKSHKPAAEVLAGRRSSTGNHLGSCFPRCRAADPPHKKRYCLRGSAKAVRADGHGMRVISQASDPLARVHARTDRKVSLGRST